jgi:hypothetical protein
MALETLERFFLDAWAILGEATEDHGIEFIARRLRDLAVAHGLEGAGQHPLPRRTRVQQSSQAKQ